MSHLVTKKSTLLHPTNSAHADKLLRVAIGRSVGWAPASSRLLFKRTERVRPVAASCALDMDQDAARLSAVCRRQAALGGA
ncbi:hypothetical protein LDENG_00139000 [Lucifuga dentata]|nr:hypothetical protein LDENG_00139000 [Lucifuga dentata]